MWAKKNENLNFIFWKFFSDFIIQFYLNIREIGEVFVSRMRICWITRRIASHHSWNDGKAMMEGGVMMGQSFWVPANFQRPEVIRALELKLNEVRVCGD